MDIKNIIIFGATGVQGQPQVAEALRHGYKVKVASRNPNAFNGPQFKGAVPVQASYDDPASLDAALRDVDAILIQVPAMGDLGKLLDQCRNLVGAIKRSEVQLTVFNSSMWAPDSPCGDPVFDGVLQTEEVFRGAGLPVVVFRPTVFMNNLQGAWIKPMIAAGVYRYAHKPELACDWICQEDLAKFMVAALKRPDLVGRKIHVGGPQRLTTLELVDTLSKATNRPIKYEYITPQQLGEDFYKLSQLGQGTGGAALPRDLYVKGFADFYTFINDSPRLPFQADVKAALQLIPVELTDMLTWAKAQNWN